MGNWGTGVFDDDFALDIENAFEDALVDGLTVEQASLIVIERLFVDDEDDEVVGYLALAALQLEHGAIQPAIRQKALELLDQGRGLAIWEGVDAITFRERQDVLQELKIQLLSEPQTAPNPNPVMGKAKKSFQNLLRGNKK